MPTRPPIFRPPFAAKPAPDSQRRGTAHSRGYGSDWRRWRLWFLRQHPLCVFRKHPSAATDCLTAADTVDHIVPLEKGGARLDEANCRAVCRNCHAKLTANLKATGVNELPAHAAGAKG